MSDRLDRFPWYTEAVPHDRGKPVPMTVPRKRWTPPAIPRVTVPDLPEWDPSRPPTDVQAWLSARLDEWADMRARAEAWAAERRGA